MCLLNFNGVTTVNITRHMVKAGRHVAVFSLGGIGLAVIQGAVQIKPGVQLSTRSGKIYAGGKWGHGLY